VEEHGLPATKPQEKKMINYAVKKAAQIPGNRPGILKKSYANPTDLEPRL
jgi:hypothetical protein